MIKISEIKNSYTQNDTVEISILAYLNKVKFGFVQDQVIKARAERQYNGKSEAYTNMKKAMPAIFPQGFKLDGEWKPTGVICIDIDGLKDEDEANEIRNKLSKDRHILGVHKSFSGVGVAAFMLVKKSTNFEQMFNTSVFYMEQNYQIIVDQSGKNINRLRYYSFDSDCCINENAVAYTELLELKKGRAPKIPTFNGYSNDIEFVINQLQKERVDITKASHSDTYTTKMKLAYMFVRECGAMAYDYTRLISELSGTHDSRRFDKWFAGIEKQAQKGAPKEVNKDTFFWLAKQSGVNIVNPENKKNYLKLQNAVKLRKVETKDQASELLGEVPVKDEIIEKVFKKTIAKENIEIHKKMNATEKLDAYFQMFPQNFYMDSRSMRVFIENENGERLPIRDRHLVEYKKQIERLCTGGGIEKNQVYEHILSEAVEVDEIKYYFDNLETKGTEGSIKELAKWFNTPTASELGREKQLEYITKQLELYLCASVARVYGKVEPNVLVLTGGQGSGKSMFFKNLLPKELTRLAMMDRFTEADFNNVGDEELAMMSDKFLILVDEMVGEAVRKNSSFKKLMSQSKITRRIPYDRLTNDFERICTFGLTTNNTSVITDDENRRMLIIQVEAIEGNNEEETDKINRAHIDKLLNMDMSKVWGDAKRLFIEKGIDSYVVSRSFKSQMNNVNNGYKIYSLEDELLTENFEVNDKGEFITFNELYNTLLTKQPKLNEKFLRAALKRAGFTSKPCRVDGKVKRGYKVNKLSSNIDKF